MSAPDAPAGYVNAIDLLGALSLAADLAIGLPAGHGVRATYIGSRIADELGLPADQRADVFYAGLLIDVGCTAWTSRIAALIQGDEIQARRELFFLSDPRDPRDVVRWLARYMATGEPLATRAKRSVEFALNGKHFMVEALRNTAEVAARLAGRLGRSPGVQQALRFAWEQWDGTGPNRLPGGSIPLVSRVVYASVFLEVFHHAWGRDGAVRLARSRRGKALDPGVVDAFTRLARDEDFWRGLEDEAISASIRGMEPDSPYRYVSGTRLDDAVTVFADVADLKSFYSPGHSRRVADLAARIATELAMPASDAALVPRAALVHDVGLVGVPSFVLHKPADRLNEAEWEALRLHPYHAERILRRVPAFEGVVPLVAAHHERPDGRGYFRGLRGDQIPLGAQVIAAADAFDDLTHPGPERAALDAPTALGEMRRGAGTAFHADAVAALARALDLPVAARPTNGAPKPAWPAGLTDREVDVLRLLATGATRQDVARRLVVSEHTVRHHLENIYGKIGVHTRVGATLFAVEQGLLT